MTANQKKKPVRKRRGGTIAEQAMQYIQFSKRITLYVLIFWGVYRLAQLVAGILRPELADALVKLSSGIDTVAITFGSAYTINSVSEKAMEMHKDVQKYMYTGEEKAGAAKTEDGASNG